MKSRGFTFIELVLVLTIIAVLFSLVGFRTGTFTFWKEEGFIRNFAETTRFLFQQASADQVSYELEIDLKNNSYRIGAVIEPQTQFNDPAVAAQMSDLGVLSLELAAILNPSASSGSQEERGGLMPPPDFPSLFEPQTPPNGMRFISIRNSRQKIAVSDLSKETIGYVYFASGGFSDFAAIEMEQSNGQRLTFVVNPFTNQVDIYRNSTDIRFEDLFSMQPSSSMSSSTLQGGSL